MAESATSASQHGRKRKCGSEQLVRQRTGVPIMIKLIRVTRTKRLCGVLSVLLTFVCGMLLNQRVHSTGTHVIFTVVRHEVQFIEEWLRYHLSIGFTHVHIYNQDDTSEQYLIQEKLDKFLKAGLVSIIPWQVGDQTGAYLHALENFAPFVKSLVFLDIDEFIVFNRTSRVEDTVHSLGLLTDYICLEFSWLSYGHSYIDARMVREKGVLQSLTRRARDVETLHAGKIMLRGGMNDYAHGFTSSKLSLPGWHDCSGYAKSEKYTLVEPADAYIAHYQMRYGNESFIARVRRGSHGDFSGQDLYKNMSLDIFEYRNAVVDVTLARLADDTEENFGN